MLIEKVPENCREAYARLISVLVQVFSLDNRSGEASIKFKEGVPMIVEPAPRYHLDR